MYCADWPDGCSKTARQDVVVAEDVSSECYYDEEYTDEENDNFGPLAQTSRTMIMLLRSQSLDRITTSPSRATRSSSLEVCKGICCIAQAIAACAPSLNS